MVNYLACCQFPIWLRWFILVILKYLFFLLYDFYCKEIRVFWIQTEKTDIVYAVTSRVRVNIMTRISNAYTFILKLYRPNEIICRAHENKSCARDYIYNFACLIYTTVDWGDGDDDISYKIKIPSDFFPKMNHSNIFINI